MAIIFPGEQFAPAKPDLESIESFDNSQIGAIEKFGEVSSGVVSIEDVLALTGGTMTGPIILAASAAGNTDASIRFATGTAPTSPTEGATWNDSTRKAIVSYLNSVNQLHSGSVFVSTASATVAGTSTETSVIGAGSGTTTLPANFFVAGKTIRMVASGYHGTAASAATLNIRAKLGATTIVATGDQTPGNSIADRAWRLTVLITCRTVGATGTVIANGIFERLEGAAGAPVGWGMITTSAITVDTTGTLAANITADWGGTDAADTITCTNFNLEVLY